MNQIKFVVQQPPKEIARCFCSICKKIYGKSPTSFAKYFINIFLSLNFDNNLFETYRSSNRASRYFCLQCKTPIYMKYDNSPNIWLNADIFQFDWSNIETYNIYR